MPIADLVVAIHGLELDEILVVQRGRKLGYKITDEQFNSYLDNIKKESKIETDEQFQSALKQENVTLADLRKKIEKSPDKPAHILTVYGYGYKLV